MRTENKLCLEIAKLHRFISSIKTPNEYIDKIDGIDYPMPYYMREIQNTYFPTASWIQEERPIYNMNKLVEWSVSGKLVWDYSYINQIIYLDLVIV